MHFFTPPTRMARRLLSCSSIVGKLHPRDEDNGEPGKTVEDSNIRNSTSNMGPEM